MIANLFHRLRLAATGLTLALVAHGAAHAGLISGEWDPGFGPDLPGLNWRVHAKLLVPNACSAQSGGVGDHIFTTTTGDCAGTVVQGVFLRLYNDGYTANNWNDLSTYSSDPPGAATWAVCDPSVAADPYYIARCSGNFSTPYAASDIRVVNGNVVGLNSGTAPTTFITMVGVDSWPSNANFNQFQLYFNTNGPVLTCLSCNDGDDIIANTTDLTQFLVTYLSNDTSEPKFTNSSGAALGAVLNGAGQFLGQAAVVPEPGTLALALAALTAFGWSRRRRV